MRAAARLPSPCAAVTNTRLVGPWGYVHRMARVAFARRRLRRLLASVVGIAAIGSCTAVAGLILSAAPARASSLHGVLPEAQSGLDVVPFPGTPDAPKGTRIDFPALAPTQLASVRAVGSRSGLHAGTLSVQPGGRGTQFAPDRPFITGERVSVSAAVRSKAAAAAAGVPGARGLRFSFRIARPVSANLSGSASQRCSGSAILRPVGCELAVAGDRGAHRPLTHTFHSAPRLHPPVVTMVGKDTDKAAGDIFLD